MNLDVFKQNSTSSTTALQQSFKRKFLSSAGQAFSIEAHQHLPVKSSAFSSLPLNTKNCTPPPQFWEQTTTKLVRTSLQLSESKLELLIPHFPSLLEIEQRPVFLSANQPQSMSPLTHESISFTVSLNPINWLLSLTKLLNAVSLSQKTGEVTAFPNPLLQKPGHKITKATGCGTIYLLQPGITTICFSLLKYHCLMPTYLTCFQGCLTLFSKREVKLYLLRNAGEKQKCKQKKSLSILLSVYKVERI